MFSRLEISISTISSPRPEVTRMIDGQDVHLKIFKNRLPQNHPYGSSLPGGY